MPLHQLPAAMEMSSAEWKDAFNFPQPKSDDFIIMHSRAKKRAMWAAQLAVDAGFKHSLVYDKVCCISTCFGIAACCSAFCNLLHDSLTVQMVLRLLVLPGSQWLALAL